MKRRDFCIRVGGVLLAVPLAVACSDDGGDPPVDAAPDADNTPDGATAVCVGGSMVSISNPADPHVLTIPEADITAGVEKEYDIQGTSPHNHTITVTAAHFTMLQQNMSVVVTSSNDAAHTHEVTISCPA